MFKKLFLIIILSLSLYDACAMQSGANAGLNPNPQFNFDKIELVLEGIDFILEAFKIGNMSPSSQHKLRIINGIDAVNKFLAGYKKLNHWGDSLVPFIYCSYDILDVVKYHKNNLSKNRKKVQYIWLGINKMLPMIIYIGTKLYLNNGYFGKLFYTLGDEPSKKACCLYNSFKIAAVFSEAARRWHQTKTIKRTLREYRLLKIAIENFNCPIAKV